LLLPLARAASQQQQVQQQQLQILCAFAPLPLRPASLHLHPAAAVAVVGCCQALVQLPALLELQLLLHPGSHLLQRLLGQVVCPQQQEELLQLPLLQLLLVPLPPLLLADLHPWPLLHLHHQLLQPFARQQLPLPLVLVV
jgi:hypothetical protein